MKFRILFLCIVMCSGVIAQSGSQFFRKDYTYIEEGEAFYKMHRVHYNWWDAKRRCGQEGATLWIPETELEVTSVIKMWKEKHGDVNSMHLGINDFVSEGYFETIDGRRIDEVYNKWDTGEPNNLLFNEDCVQIKFNGLMNDIFCYINQAFVCKKTLSTLEWNSLCDIPDLDYIFNGTSGKCYKVHNYRKTWSEAYTICSVEQSYLAIINNDKEAEVMVKIFADLSKGKTKHGCLIHLGFRTNDAGDWTTLQENRLEDSGYTKWGPYQPDYYDRRNNCGAMTPNGELHDISCDHKGYFICEHDIGLLNSSVDERFGITE